MKSCMIVRYAARAAVAAGLSAAGVMGVSVPASAQYAGWQSPRYYDRGYGYNGMYDYVPNQSQIYGEVNPSVPFDPSEAAMDRAYGKPYGFCGFTIAGC